MSNTIAISGRLGKDSERKQAGGSTLLQFSVGDSVGFGEKKTTNWWRCNIWGKQAEGQLMDYLVKGAQVVVYGEVTLREHEGKIYPDIRVNNIDLVGSRDTNSAPKQQAPQQQGYGQAQPKTTAGGGTSDLDDDLPFAPIHSILG